MTTSFRLLALVAIAVANPLLAGQVSVEKQVRSELIQARDVVKQRFAVDKAGSIKLCRDGLKSAHAKLQTRPELQIVIDESVGSAEARELLMAVDVVQHSLTKVGARVRKDLDRDEVAELEQFEKTLPELRAKALEHKSKGDLQQAIKTYNTFIDHSVRLYGVGGANDKNLALALNRLGVWYGELSEHARALPLHERSVQMLRVHGKAVTPAEMAICLDNLGWACVLQMQFTKGRLVLEESLKIRGENAPDAAYALRGLGQLSSSLAKKRDAVDYLRRSLGLYEKGNDVAGLIHCLNDLADVYLDHSEDGAAEKCLARSLALCQVKLSTEASPANRLVLVQCMQRQAKLHMSRGDVGTAEKVMEDAKQKCPSGSLELAACLDGLALLRLQTARHQEAAELYQESLVIRKKHLGDAHPNVANTLNSLAMAYRGKALEKGAAARAWLEKSAQLLRESRQIAEAKLGNEHPAVANTMHNLAGVLARLGRLQEAKQLYEAALPIFASSLGKETRDYALTLDELGRLSIDLSEHAAAMEKISASLEIRKKILIEFHPDVALGHHHLALAFAAQKKPEQAAANFEADRKILRRYLTRVLPFLGQSEQLQFLRFQEERDIARALSLALLYPKEHDVQTKAAGWLVNGQAVAQQVLAESTLLARAAHDQDKQMAKLFTELEEVRKQLSRVAVGGSRDDELAKRERDLAVQLRKSGSQLENAIRWIDLGEVRTQLSQDTAFINIARFEPYDLSGGPNRAGAAARYAAWITFADGNTKLVDLGDAGLIDAIVTQLRKGFAGAPKAITTDGEPEAEKHLTVVLEGLSKRILHPLLPHIAMKTRWILCPDGDLWLVPWNALPLADGKYAVEKHTISYVTSGRDLVYAATRPRVALSTALVLGDPDFDLSFDTQPSPESKDSPRSGSLAELLRKNPAPRLPGTATEAEKIRLPLKSYTKAEPRVLLREYAVKAAVRDAKSPCVLVLSTHGYFLPAPEAKGAADNPLLRSGLLLAGCNHKQSPQQGILTGLELIGVDLRGCDLVVLSACETAVGEVQHGEGVAGLRQCFQLAGADAVVATLWQIPDRSSARQMMRFFERLAQGKGKAEALATAQREMIEARRKNEGAAHPFFWAAFTVTGAADRSGDLQPPTVTAPMTPAQIEQALHKALVAGITLYNDKQDYSGCCEAFQRGLQAARTALTERPALQVQIDQGLAKASSIMNAAERALALRAVIDAVRKTLKSSP
jgi:CHAT domain-containing protein/tetratricopeptide (TPR) repeat protein